MTLPTLLILNPASGHGATGRRAEELVARAEASCGPLTVATTAAPGDATRLAREATQQGVARILVAGGDGTTSEVVTGILAAQRFPEPRLADPRLPAQRLAGNGPAGPTLGILPVGSGCDLARSLGLPRTFESALEVVAAGLVRPIDAGRVELGDGRGGRAVRFFANEVSAGLSGDTVARAGAYAKRLGPRLGFVGGALSAVSGHAPFEAVLELDGECVHEGPISLLAIANGCYFGAGMRVAPDAALDDGFFEVVLARGLPRHEILRWLPAFYLGQHGRHPKVSFHPAQSVVLRPLPGGANGGTNDGATAAAVEVDGEGGFALPLAVRCLPGALRIHTPAVTIPLAVARRAPLAPRVPAPLAVHRERA